MYLFCIIDHGYISFKNYVDDIIRSMLPIKCQVRYFKTVAEAYLKMTKN